MRNKGKKSKKRQLAAVDSEGKVPSPTPPPLVADRASSPTPGPSQAVSRSSTPPPDASEVLEVVSGPIDVGTVPKTLPTVGKGKGRGKKSKEKVEEQLQERKPRNNFALSQEQEDAMFEWLEENELLWRKGHRLFKDTNRKKALWQEKGRELQISSEHLQGWWRGMHTWYVKLHKVKSGQAAKKLTDREKYVLQKCSFYEGELRHRSSAPMKPLPRDVDLDAAEAASEAASEVESVLPDEADRDEEVTEGLLSNIEKTYAQATKSVVYSKLGTSTKRKRQDAEEEECLREIRDSMKANTQLLSQLVGEKSSSLREPFINYVSDTLRRLPDHQYNAMMRKINSLLQNLNATDSSPTADLLYVQSATPLLRQSQFAPPEGMYQQYPQYQQPQSSAYHHYQSSQQYQLSQTQPPGFSPHQPTQSQQSNTSGATDQPRRSADSLSQVLESTHDVLDGSLNMSLSGLGDYSLPSMKSLNTPPAPITSPPVIPQPQGDTSQ